MIMPPTKCAYSINMHFIPTRVQWYVVLYTHVNMYRHKNVVNCSQTDTQKVIQTGIEIYLIEFFLKKGGVGFLYPR